MTAALKALERVRDERDRALNVSVAQSKVIEELRERVRIAEAVRDDARAASARDLETRRGLAIDHVHEAWAYRPPVPDTTPSRHLPGRCEKCKQQACLNCRERIVPELDWEKTTYVTGDCTVCSPEPTP